MYISAGALVLIGIVYLPTAVAVLWWVSRRLSGERAIRIGVLVTLALLLLAVPFWDVGITSFQMLRLCKAAGLKINKTVEAEGYFANIGYGEQVLGEGFSYFEKLAHPSRLTIYVRTDGKIAQSTVNPKKEPYHVRSRFEYTYDPGSSLPGSLNIAVARSKVIDRANGEVLGEATAYTAFPGWVDRNSIMLLGQHFWTCPSDTGLDISLLRQTIRPVKQ